jgi:Xaa-Pro aminopeptidase
MVAPPKGWHMAHTDTPAFDGFSAAEFARRRRALEDVLRAHDLTHAVLYGSNRSGPAVPWLTGWPVTREAHVLVTVGQPDVLLVSFFNHGPEAARRAADADVRFAGDDPAATVNDLLRERGAAGERIGLIGALPFDQYATIAADHPVVDLRRDHTRLRLRKSAEEIAALRYAAALTDDAVHDLLSQPLIGRSEHELAARIEQSYVSRGGGHHIHYLGVTSMAQPDRCVPAQWPRDRRIERGDVLTFEISAAAAPDYSGQLLRTVTIGEEATAELRRLHEVADQVLGSIEALLRPGVHAEQLVAVSGVVEDAGYTTVDDLVHGFGGGYLPPVLGTRSRAIRPTPDMALEEGMTLVVQPNVSRPDFRLGVQTGDLMLVTADGAERLHRFPRGMQFAER